MNDDFEDDDTNAWSSDPSWLHMAVFIAGVAVATAIAWFLR